MAFDAGAIVGRMIFDFKNFTTGMLKAKQGIRELSTQVPGLSGRVDGLGTNFISTGAAMFAASLATQAFNKIISTTSQVVAGAINNIESFNTSTISTAAILTSMAKNPSHKTFIQNLEYAKQAMNENVKVAAKYVASGKEISIVFQAMAMQGVVPITKKDFDNLGKITDAIKIITAGQSFEMQGMQEIRSLMDGRVRATDRLGKLIKAQVGDLGAWVQKHKEAGDIITAIGEKLQGFAEAQTEVVNLIDTVKNTLEGIWDVISRAGFAGVYKDIVNSLKAIQNLLMTEEGLITPMGRMITEKIQKAWDKVGDSVAGLLDLIIKNAPDIVSYLGSALATVAEWAKYALMTMLEIAKLVRGIQSINIHADVMASEAKIGKLEKRVKGLSKPGIIEVVVGNLQEEGKWGEKLGKNLYKSITRGRKQAQVSASSELARETEKLKELEDKYTKIKAEDILGPKSLIREKLDLTNIFKNFRPGKLSLGAGEEADKGAGKAGEESQKKIKEAVIDRIKSSIDWIGKHLIAENKSLSEVDSGYKRVNGTINSAIKSRIITEKEGIDLIRTWQDDRNTYVKKLADEEIERVKKVKETKMSAEQETFALAHTDYENRMVEINREYDEEIKALNLTNLKISNLKLYNDTLKAYEDKRIASTNKATIENTKTITDNQESLLQEQIKYGTRSLADLRAFYINKLALADKNKEEYFKIQNQIKEVDNQEWVSKDRLFQLDVELGRKTLAQYKTFLNERLATMQKGTEEYASMLKQIQDVTKQLDFSQDIQTMWDEMLKSMYGSFKTFFVDAITGQFKTLGDAFRGFMKAVQEAFAEFAAQMVASWFWRQLLGLIMPTVGRSSVPGTEHGVDVFNVQTAAVGAVVSKPTLALVGDQRGVSEAIIPMPSGYVQAQVIDKGKKDTPLNVNILNIIDPSFLGAVRRSDNEIINVINKDILTNGVTRKSVGMVLA